MARAHDSVPSQRLGTAYQRIAQMGDVRYRLYINGHPAEALGVPFDWG